MSEHARRLTPANLALRIMEARKSFHYVDAFNHGVEKSEGITAGIKPGLLGAKDVALSSRFSHIILFNFFRKIGF